MKSIYINYGECVKLTKHVLLDDNIMMADQSR